MGHEGAAWLERPEREDEEQPSKAIAALDIKPGQVVADVGAGSGYYTVRLAERVLSLGAIWGFTTAKDRNLRIGRIRKCRKSFSISVRSGFDSQALPPS